MYKINICNLLVMLSFLMACTPVRNTPNSTEAEHEELSLSDIKLNHNEIIHGLEDELKDSIINKNFHTLTNEMIESLENIENNKSSLFPFFNVQSAELYNNRNGELIYVKKLTADEIKKLILILNNPLFYQWGECGTPETQYRIVFYGKGLKKSRIDISCNYTFIECYPDNRLVRFGGMTKEGSLKLQKFTNW